MANEKRKKKIKFGEKEFFVTFYILQFERIVD